MMQALAWFSNAMSSTNWLEVIRTLAPVATAVIAFLALKNWQRQDKAKREAEFLDALIEAAHTYVAEVPRPITVLEIAKIGMASHARPWEAGDASDAGETSDVAVKGAVAFIQRNGEREAKRLLEELSALRQWVVKLRSLAAKGLVFRFAGYSKCLNAVEMLTWHFGRMEAFAAMTGSPTWNWENPEVLGRLKDVMAIDPDEMRRSVQQNNVALLEFAGETYKRIYG